MNIDQVQINGFLLPGHVSVILGRQAYQSFFDRYQVPSVVAGFEPTDILEAVRRLVDQIEKGHPQLDNGNRLGQSAVVYWKNMGDTQGG